MVIVSSGQFRICYCSAAADRMVVISSSSLLFVLSIYSPFFSLSPSLFRLLKDTLGISSEELIREEEEGRKEGRRRVSALFANCDGGGGGKRDGIKSRQALRASHRASTLQNRRREGVHYSISRRWVVSSLNLIPSFLPLKMAQVTGHILAFLALNAYRGTLSVQFS